MFRIALLLLIAAVWAPLPDRIGATCCLFMQLAPTCCRSIRLAGWPSVAPAEGEHFVASCQRPCDLLAEQPVDQRPEQAVGGRPVWGRAKLPAAAAALNRLSWHQRRR